MGHIRDGNYDLLMVKPGSVIVLSIASSIEPENVGVFFGGLGMFIYSLVNLPTASVVNWLQFTFFFIASVILSFGLVLIMSATSFKWVGNSRIFEMYEALTTFGRYPGTVFSKALIWIISFVLPVATLGYLPAAALLNRNDAMMLLVILPCLGFAVIGVLLFKYMVYKYQSAGG